MRWIPLFAMAASFAVVSSAAEYGDAPAATSGPEVTPSTATGTEPELEGVVVERANGGYMTLTMDAKKLVLKFFDETKKPVAVDVSGGFVRFLFGNRSPERRPLYLGADGMFMTHGEPLRPPHVFQAHITLTHGDGSDGDDGEGESTAEKYIVSFP